MGKYHTVVQGEFLAKIARAYGFASYLSIWGAPENKELKEKRKNPNVLYPGDRLFIPDKETKEESCPTEKKHKFRRQGEDLKLRIVLMGLKNEPLDGHECTLIIEGGSKDFTTKSNGLLEEDISAKAAVGKLLDNGKPGPEFRTQRQIPLKIGHLDPVEELSGQIARLNNLGYNAGEVPEHQLTADQEQEVRKSPQFLSAVEEFQCDFGLQVDGICGPQTQAKLLKEHGC